MPNHIILPELEVHRLYITERQSLKATAKALDCSVQVILTNMRNYGIETRSLSESHKGQHTSITTQFKTGQKSPNRLELDTNKIIELYQTGKSSVEIGRMFGVSHKTILQRLKENGIERKSVAFYNTDKPMSLEFREKIRQANIGKVGKPHSEESKKKISERMKMLHTHKIFGWKINNDKRETLEELLLEKLLQDAEITEWIREYIIKSGNKGGYRIDFAWPSHKLGIELDGNSHKKRILHDIKRDEFLRTKGWQIVRISNKSFLSDTATTIQMIKNLLK